MKISKTYKLYSLFTVKELKRLHLFIHSDYFNKEKNVKKMYSFLRENFNKSLKKELVYNFIYPKERFNISRYNYLSTTLFNLFKEFIIIENALNNKSFYDTNVLNKLKELNQKDLFVLEENIIIKKDFKTIKKKSSDYQKKYLFEYERLNFYAEQKRTETKYVKSLHFNLDAYYLIEKLKVACTEINQQKLYKTERELKLTKIIIDYINETDLITEIPLLSIYYNAYNMLTSNKKKDFILLKKDLEEFDFEEKEITDAFIFGLNFCIQKLNAGDTTFNNEIFEMYQTGIQKNILLKKGKLSHFTFSNIVTIGLRLKRFEEVETFIEKNKKLLSGAEKQTYYSFNLAKLLFEKGEFEKVTALYNEKLIKEILLNIQMRILQIKAFYELGEFDICESLISSTDQLLNRKGILAYHKKVFKNFIKFSKSLITINHLDKSEIQSFKNKIENIETIIDKKWLIEKLKFY